MANTVVSKSVGIQGSSQGNRVVYHVDTAETLDSDDFTFTYQIKNFRNGIIRTIFFKIFDIKRRIVKIILIVFEWTFI